MHETDVWKMNKSGSPVFKNKDAVNKTHYRVKSVFEHPAAAYIVMAVCAAIDFALFYQLLSKAVYDDPFTMYMTTFGLLVGFDFAPCYLGMKFREAKQGYKVNGIIQWILLASFVIAFLGNLWLRIVMRDKALPDLSGSTSLLGAVSTETSVNPLAPAFAAFAAMIPLVTSFCSFGISYAVSNPLRKELEILDRELAMMEDDIQQTGSVLKEYETDEQFYQRILQDDARRLEECVALTYERALSAADYVRERIKEHIADPGGINELSKEQYDHLLELLNEQSADRLARKIVEAVRIAGQEQNKEHRTVQETDEPYAA